MKKNLLFAIALGVGSALVFGAAAPDLAPVAAAPGGRPGEPGGGGGETPDYGDLLVLARDANGVPIPSDPVMVPDPETGELVPGGLCWQPIAAVDFSYEGWDLPTDRVVIPEVSTQIDGVDAWLIPVDQYNCAVEAFFATHTQEVDFGRTNEARSPVTVFESQLEDVLIKLATADSTSLDPAGRMVASSCEEDGAATTSTIDSPLQNLAIYRQLMLTGSIGTPLPQLADIYQTAARGLGAASDKSGEVTVDMVAYLNQLMGLDVAPTILPKLTGTYREEVQGTIQEVTKQYLDYGSLGYDRQTNFSGLPSPSYIPKSGPQAGWFEYLSVLDPTVPSFTIVQGPILEPVFESLPGITSGNIGGFAQAADDARAVIEFMHDWPMPDADVYGTPVPCVADPELTTYDVSISAVSGLQVPKQIVDGSEGREFVVTVANAGPDAASGLVTVTATADNGGAVIGSPWAFTFTDLAAGASQSFDQFFTVSLGERTTIEWAAQVTAEDDVNPANNTVTETTSVKVTGGGRR